MASIKFTGLILSLVIILHASEYPSIDAHEGSGMETKRERVTPAEENASPQKDVDDGIFVAADAVYDDSRKGLGGRKMLADDLLKKEPQKKHKLDENNSKISGRGTTNASKISPGRPFNDDQLNYEPEKQKSSASKGLNRTAMLGTNTNSASSIASPNSGPSSSTMPTFHNHRESAKKEDSQAFLEAADEVVNLIQKDYKGQDRPRRKPPINNHKPTD